MLRQPQGGDFLQRIPNGLMPVRYVALLRAQASA